MRNLMVFYREEKMDSSFASIFFGFKQSEGPHVSFLQKVQHSWDSLPGRRCERFPQAYYINQKHHM